MKHTAFVIPARGTDPSIPSRLIKILPDAPHLGVGSKLSHTSARGHDSGSAILLRQSADRLEKDGASIPYPALTKGPASRGRIDRRDEERRPQHSANKALDHVLRLASAIDPHPPRPALAARKKERPWEIGSLRHSATARRGQSTGADRHPAKGPKSGVRHGPERPKVISPSYRSVP